MDWSVGNDSNDATGSADGGPSHRLEEMGLAELEQRARALKALMAKLEKDAEDPVQLSGHIGVPDPGSNSVKEGKPNIASATEGKERQSQEPKPNLNKANSCKDAMTSSLKVDRRKADGKRLRHSTPSPSRKRHRK
ncbi:hypothetical protein BIW11_10585 [Tropilaelaps mercedesae]|uniref:Uncharacterized protein n=1 Tax=Tropilaelaps mercedesae TaxID=418985 RepID=A0A1V9XEY1_9ACAR|nr:hypothetical protein BIW11_10585 [Tropilaelaps mercedesae]